MDEKKVQLKNALPLREPLFRRDVILHVELVALTEEAPFLRTLSPVRIWRRLKCSGGLTLRQFQDRVLNPGFGWARNYHAYLFYDPNDGSKWGAIGFYSVDVTHVTEAESFLSDMDVKLGELLFDVNHTLLYLYDLGERFLHKITLEHIESTEASNGAVQLLDGYGMNMFEDAFGMKASGTNGFEKWCALNRASEDYYHKLVDGMCALNYRYSHVPVPEVCPIEDNRAAIAAAIKAPASLPQGNKMAFGNGICLYDINSSTRPSDCFLWKSDPTYHLGKTPDTIRLAELIRTSRDPKEEAVCASCGSPHDLEVCSRCKWRWYCGRTCQVSDWERHKSECSPNGKRPNPGESHNGILPSWMILIGSCDSGIEAKI